VTEEEKKSEERRLASITKWETYIESCKEVSYHAIDRFDVLIISLSTGALGFSLGFLKDFVKTDPQLFIVLKISWIFFASAIVVNLFSQLTSFYTQVFAIKRAECIIAKKKEKEFDPKSKGRQERKMKIFNFGTNLFNLCSLLLLIAGIVLTIIFVYRNS